MGTSQSTNWGESTRPSASCAAITAAQSLTRRPGSGRPPPGGDPHREDDGERRQAPERSHELTQRARHVGASHLAGPALGDADTQAAEPQVVRGDARRQHEIPGDALDLDASRELGPDGEPRLAGREGEERQNDRYARRSCDRGRERRLAPAEPPVHVDHGEWREEEG